MNHRAKWAIFDLSRLGSARKSLMHHKQIAALSRKLKFDASDWTNQCRGNFWHLWVSVRKNQDNGRRLPV